MNSLCRKDGDVVFFIRHISNTNSDQFYQRKVTLLVEGAVTSRILFSWSVERLVTKRWLFGKLCTIWARAKHRNDSGEPLTTNTDAEHPNREVQNKLESTRQWSTLPAFFLWATFVADSNYLPFHKPDPFSCVNWLLFRPAIGLLFLRSKYMSCRPSNSVQSLDAFEWSRVLSGQHKWRKSTKIKFSWVNTKSIKMDSIYCTTPSLQNFSFSLTKLSGSIRAETWCPNFNSTFRGGEITITRFATSGGMLRQLLTAAPKSFLFRKVG